MSPGATACAGLGLFFVGMRLISAHLRDLASGGIRQLIGRMMDRPAIASAAGLLAGAVTQSTSAVTFIATGLVSARAISLTIAISMLAWANAGTSVLVLLASFDVHTITLYLLGLTGFAFFNGLDQHPRYRHGIYALLGLGLLLMGLGLIKSTVSEVRNDFWLQEFIEFSTSSVGISLLAGYVIAIALQSSSIVVALALPLVSEGVLNLYGMSYLMLGACAGSGAAVVFVSAGLEGPARQLALSQGLIRAIASLLLVFITLAEQANMGAGLLHLSRLVVNGETAQVGVIFLAVQLTGVFVGWVLRKPILRWVASGAPESPAEILSRPAFIYDDAAADLTTAMELLRLEHLRQVRALPEFLEDLRSSDERPPDSPPLQVRAEASAAVMTRMVEFLSETGRSNPEGSADQIYEMRKRINDLIDLQKTLTNFVSQLSAIPVTARPTFLHPLIEGIHALLGVVSDASEQDGDDARLMLEDLTDGRGELIERARRELLNGTTALAEREILLDAVMHLERIIWLLRGGSVLPTATLGRSH